MNDRIAGHQPASTTLENYGGPVVERAGRSPQRPIRIPDDPWYRAVARAKREGRTIGHVVTELLSDYADADAG